MCIRDRALAIALRDLKIRCERPIRGGSRPSTLKLTPSEFKYFGLIAAAQAKWTAHDKSFHRHWDSLGLSGGGAAHPELAAGGDAHPAGEASHAASQLISTYNSSKAEDRDGEDTKCSVVVKSIDHAEEGYVDLIAVAQAKWITGEAPGMASQEAPRQRAKQRQQHQQMSLIDISFLMHHVCPYLLSIELGPPIRCAMVSLRTTCSTYSTLWPIDASTQNVVIVHDDRSVSFCGAVSYLEFETYVHAALRASVVHPLRMGSRDIHSISRMINLGRPFLPGFLVRHMAPIATMVQFTFEHRLIRQYFHGVYMSPVRLISTTHWISAKIHERQGRFVDLCLQIADFQDDGVHALGATAGFAYVEPSFAGFDSPRFAYAAKFVRIDSVFVGLPSTTNERHISSTTLKWSDTEWPPELVDGCDFTYCSSACVEAALRKAEQEHADLIIGAFVQVKLAMRDDGEWLPITSLRVSQDSQEGDLID